LGEAVAIEMIITDLDMTVLRTDKSISDFTRNVFKSCAENGIVTAIATARYYIGAERYIDALNPHYEITTDGTMTYQNGKFLFGTGFDIDTTNDIVGEIKDIAPNLELTVATDKCVYWNSKNISESPVLYKAIYNDYASPLIECAYKIVAELPDSSMADAISRKYDCKVISYRGEDRYGFIHQSAGKIQAIRSLAQSVHIPLSEIAAFGDDLNDIEMLTECGYGVAVENALAEVKKASGYICESNDNDGVAKFIEKHVLCN
jgi:Cof subfamily protein (haloacid dehalogenase superfamily)